MKYYYIVRVENGVPIEVFKYLTRRHREYMYNTFVRCDQDTQYYKVETENV